MKHARGLHASFFVASRHGVDLVFHRLGYSDLLVIPRSCCWVLLTEFHFSVLAGHFGAKKMCSLLSECIWWPNMLESFKSACYAWPIC